MKNIFTGSGTDMKTFLLIIWGIIGLIYIVVDVKGQLNDLESAQQQGALVGVSQIVTQAMELSDKCEIVPLVMGEKKVNLINMDCLEKKAETE